MDCPKCKLINPPCAERCDCGYDFKTGTMQESYLTERGKRHSKPEIAALFLGLACNLVLRQGFMWVAGEEHSAAPLLLAVVVLSGALVFWMWRRETSAQR